LRIGPNLLALREHEVVVVDPLDGRLIGRLRTGRGSHNFWPQGDGRHYFLTNRLDGTVSRIDTQEMRVTDQIRVPAGPDCIDMTPHGKELWVTQRFRRRVAVVDLSEMKMVASIPVGTSPHGVFISRPLGPDRLSRK
jgi:DNA-binding beta-propeller fold protein YncE